MSHNNNPSRWKQITNGLRKWLVRSWKTEEKRRVVSNMFSLSIIQVFNYLLPLLTFPYLARILKAEYFGLLAVVTSTMNYFIILTDYGFGLTGPREVAIHREKSSKIDEIWSSVMGIKGVLVILSFLILLILTTFVPRFQEHGKIYLLAYGMIVGYALSPNWFFQGMEKMKYIIYANVVTKLIFTVTIFIFVRSADDYYKVPLLNSLGFIAGGVLSFIIAQKQFGVRFHWRYISKWKYYLKESGYIFLSAVITSIYTTLSPVILSFFATNSSVGYFAGANKIVSITLTMFIPFSNALYPYMSKKAYQTPKAFPSLIRKLTLIVGGMAGIVVIGLWIFAPWIVNLLLGSAYKPTIWILRILSLKILFSTISTVFGSQGLLPLNRKKTYTFSTGIMSVVAIGLFVLFVPRWQEMGIAIALVLVEFGIAILMFFALAQEGIWWNLNKVQPKEKKL